jgi:hypothetical protein
VDRIEDESVCLLCPGVADVFIGRESFQDLEPTGEVVGGDEVREMPRKLFVSLVVIAIYRRFFDGSVHALHLTICPRVVWFGQAMLDAIGSADLVEAMDPVSSRPPIAIARQVGELDAVIGKHGVQRARRGATSRHVDVAGTHVWVIGSGS